MEHGLIVAEAVHQIQLVAQLVLDARRTVRASFTAGTGGPAFQVPLSREVPG